jgi:hypothetical protein
LLTGVGRRNSPDVPRGLAARSSLSVLTLVATECDDLGSNVVKEASVKFYHLGSIRLWGDYGHILVNGMTEEKDGQLQLKRTGPFVPPITFPGLSDLVVTDGFKKVLESLDIGSFECRPVLKARIVTLRWERFDRDATEPPIRPKNGEPEEYILARPHSPSVAKAMGELWQVVLRDGAIVDTDIKRAPWDYDVRVHARTWNGDHLFYGKKPDAYFGRWILVTEKGKEWLEHHVGDWVRFELLPIK